MKGGPVAEPREQAAYNRLLRRVEQIAGSVDLENEEDSFAAATHYLLARWRRCSRADRYRLLAIMASCTISHFTLKRKADREGVR